MHFGWFLAVIPGERSQGGDYPLPPGSPLLNGRGRFLCLWVRREEGGLPQSGKQCSLLQELVLPSEPGRKAGV